MGKNLIEKGFLCPVCGGYYFLPLTEEEIQRGEKLEDDWCGECGWCHDEKQLHDFDLRTEYNAMSINERKQWYQSKKKVNPKFCYFDELDHTKKPHKCKVCGKYTFKDVITYDICPYCGWEDDGYDSGNLKNKIGSNGCIYSDYKKRYEELIKNNPNYKWKESND